MAARGLYALRGLGAFSAHTRRVVARFFTGRRRSLATAEAARRIFAAWAQRRGMKMVAGGWRKEAGIEAGKMLKCAKILAKIQVL